MPPPSPLAPDARPGPTPDGPWVLDCRGRALDCRPGAPAHVMGILNVTPDSFSDGGRYAALDAALARAEAMLEEGATLIDVGGESSRPAGAAYGAGAAAVPAEEELRRVVPVVEALARRFPHALLSVDTYKGEVARAALAAGAHVVNDITGLRDGAGTAHAAAAYGAPLIVMHSAGTPGRLPHETRGPAAPSDAETEDIVDVVTADLARAVAAAEAAGVRHVVTDPGFGFGKAPAENLRLVGRLGALVALGRPVLVGLSRKHTVGVVLGSAAAPAPVGERLFGTLGLTALAVLGGAAIVRTHDVRPTVELLRALAAGLDAAGRAAAGQAVPEASRPEASRPAACPAEVAR